MAKVIHTVPHLISPLNGVIFTALERPEGGSISEEISDEVAQNFLLIPTFELFVDPAAAPAVPVKPAQETKEQRKARLAAEAAAEKEAADKAAAEKAEADRLAAEQQAPAGDENAPTEEPKPEGGEDEVF